MSDTNKGPSQIRDRNEADHKDLINKANTGIGAIKELRKHYGDVTTILADDSKGLPKILEDADVRIDVTLGIKP